MLRSTRKPCCRLMPMRLPLARCPGWQKLPQRIRKSSKPLQFRSAHENLGADMSVHSLDRRGLLKVGVLSGLSAAAAFPHAEGDGRARTRRFLLNLSCGRIGCKATFVESVDLAIRNGFEAVDP